MFGDVVDRIDGVSLVSVRKLNRSLKFFGIGRGDRRIAVHCRSLAENIRDESHRPWCLNPDGLRREANALDAYARSLEVIS